jgi:hypothetical protein
MARARPFRPADVPPDLGGGWSGRTYVTDYKAAAEPVRH